MRDRALRWAWGSVALPLAAIANNGAARLRWLNRPTPDIAEIRKTIENIVVDAQRAASLVAARSRDGFPGKPLYDGVKLSGWRAGRLVAGRPRQPCIPAKRAPFPEAETTSGD